MSDVRVTLDIRPGGGPVEEGWTNVQASNGATYGYLFAGGTNGRGDIEQPVGEQVVIYLECIAQPYPRYQLGGSIITDNDPNNEISGIVDDITVARIFDRNDVAESDAEWSVAVADTEAKPSCTIICDPKVTNDPNR